MDYTEYPDPKAFLSRTQSVFEDDESLHGLMLGVSLRLVEDPFHYGTQPFLATTAKNTKLDLIAVMTPPHKLQIASLNDDMAESIELVANKLHVGGWHVPAVIAQEPIARRFASEWNRRTAARPEPGMRQRIYEVRVVDRLDFARGRFRRATMEDAHRAARWLSRFHDECFGGSTATECVKNARCMIEKESLYFWEDPSPVSMAGLIRPTKRGVSIGYVYTPSQFRRNGYASAVVASLSRLALKNGKEFCTLYTDLSNPTSNRIYQKIGYRAIADVMDVSFTNTDEGA